DPRDAAGPGARDLLARLRDLVGVGSWHDRRRLLDVRHETPSRRGVPLAARVPGLRAEGARPRGLPEPDAGERRDIRRGVRRAVPAVKVLHAVHNYPPEFRGGIERVVEALAAAQVAAGHEVAVLAGSETSAAAPESRRGTHAGVPVIRLVRG